ncbi:prolipoprotein diacylglyceryl transferase [Marinospirillum alkaliphilum]|uniref:Phosphatidylglycerol--prolipoprotein diacylglyceryl transferase n=1 Tax=Marinospirillum alkaliphilum DSM 21637 TaxID=1122209 RepID=A0A1K1W296_9GAMM|nr:prolipoprotein diacylglyceryl transferase [Marinospirillum alkaliphilum]SFX30949.1 phosphatidylglycerol:prolipoprotein diacylglycerol transferase [Marinospirillum alkaliphilum DSM 21637]
MLTYPSINPVAISLGPVQIHWYGLAYLVGFLVAWWLARQRAERLGLTREQISDLTFYAAVGVILGGRLGYALFYHFDRVLIDPLWLLRVWEGGMAFHGGFLGVAVAVWLFARKHRLNLFQLGDFVAPLTPIGLGLGRLGNFINGELWGRVTDSPLGMVFPGAGPDPRHPSQLYQFALEGVVLFALLWWFSRQPRPAGSVSGLFLVGYGSLRFLGEFAREPDAHLGLLLGGLSMGQLLSLPMLLAGVALMVWAYQQDQQAPSPSVKSASSQPKSKKKQKKS